MDSKGQVSIIPIAFLTPLSPEAQQMFEQIDLAGRAQTVIACDSCGREYVLIHPATFRRRDIEVYRNYLREHSGGCHNGHVPFIRYPEGLPSTQI